MVVGVASWIGPARTHMDGTKVVPEFARQGPFRLLTVTAELDLYNELAALPAFPRRFQATAPVEHMRDSKKPRRCELCNGKATPGNDLLRQWQPGPTGWTMQHCCFNCCSAVKWMLCHCAKCRSARAAAATTIRRNPQGAHYIRLTHRDNWFEFFSVMLGAFGLAGLADCLTWNSNSLYSAEDLNAAKDGFGAAGKLFPDFDPTELPDAGQLYTQKLALEDVVACVKVALARAGVHELKVDGLLVIVDDRVPYKIPGFDHLNGLNLDRLNKWEESGENWEVVFVRLPTALRGPSVG